MIRGLTPFRAAGAGTEWRTATADLWRRPDRMRHVVRNGELEGWEYVDAAG